ncbi:hypothetical protein KAR91_57475 [Candidatus Pacearchaeota archaeon]|nr:hypothetical protein [Candidatus Pacearchaeota archaeon]
MMEKNETLKPCRCGGKSSFMSRGDSHGSNRTYHWVECTKCHAKTKEYGDYDYDDAFNEWNHRPSPSEVVGEAEAICKNWPNEHDSDIIDAIFKLIAENTKLAARVGELEKCDSELGECVELLSQYDGAMGCNGHLQVAGHLKNILAQLKAMTAERDDYHNQYHLCEAKLSSHKSIIRQLQKEIADGQR